MLFKTLKSYDELGYRVDVGKPSRLYSVMIDKNNKHTISASGGFTILDAFVFMAIERIIKPKNIFIIGNAFGLSTIFLAELFPDAEIDVIDAEIEGLETKIGSDLTEEVNKKDFGNIKLTKGFSPQDLPQAMRAKRYNLIFIDGLHTNEQILLDFYGILPYCDEKCILYLHDVAFAKMFESWEIIKNEGEKAGFKSFEMGFTQMGCTALVRGYNDLIEYMQLISNKFDGPYYIGFESNDLNRPTDRPYFWDYSFYFLEKLIKRKIKKNIFYIRRKFGFIK
jgi:hypothetical protein